MQLESIYASDPILVMKDRGYNGKAQNSSNISIHLWQETSTLLFLSESCDLSPALQMQPT